MKTLLHSSFLLLNQVMMLMSSSIAGSGRVTHSGFKVLATPNPLLQIRSDGRRLCGVTAAHRVVCSIYTSDPGSTLTWQALDRDGIIAVAVNGSSVWVIDDIYTVSTTTLTPSGTNEPWSSAPGWLVDIVTDGMAFAAVGTNNFLFYRNTSQPAWSGVGSSKSRSVDVIGPNVVSVRADGSLWFNPAKLFPGSNGPFRSISSDGTFACATKDTTETVYCITKDMIVWQPVGGRLSQISVRKGRLFGVGRNGTLWTTTLKLSTSPDDYYRTLDDQEKADEGTLVQAYLSLVDYAIADVTLKPLWRVAQHMLCSDRARQ
ncbi:hypothetical protein PINS_up006886 [Pythium insidiosum]|nr:hypothetical protein PINS_up006886 [Pythium insidiosum]